MQIDEIVDDLTYDIPKLKKAQQVVNNLERYSREGNKTKILNYMYQEGDKTPLDLQDIQNIHNIIMSGVIDTSLNYKETLLETWFTKRLKSCIVTMLQNNDNYFCNSLFLLTQSKKHIPQELYLLTILESTIMELFRQLSPDDEAVSKNKFTSSMGQALISSYFSDYLSENKALGRHLTEFFLDSASLEEVLNEKSEAFMLLLKQFKKFGFTSETLHLFILHHLYIVVSAWKVNSDNYKFMPEYHHIISIDTQYSLINFENDLYNKIHPLFIRMGIDIFDILLEDELISTSTIRTKSGYNLMCVEFSNTEFLTYYRIEMPALVEQPLESTFELRKYTNYVHYFARKKIRIKKNKNGYGSLKRPDVITKVLQNTRFCINRSFCYEFFELLYECYTLARDDLTYNTLSKSDCHLRFLSEIFGVNFIALRKNTPSTYFLDILQYTLDFHGMIPFPDPEANSKYSLSLHNTLKSKKISFVDLLISIIIMKQFEHFHYDWFADFRLRIYYFSSALNLMLPLSRSFLCFYDKIPVNILDCRKLQDLLLSQVRSVSTTNSILFSDLDDLTLKNILIKYPYKFSEAFTFYHSAHDYLNLHEKNLVFRFRCMINYDSSNSGAQMLGLVCRSKDIAKLCLLYKDNFIKHDVYTDFMEYCSKITAKIKDMFIMLFERYPFLDIFFKNLANNILNNFASLEDFDGNISPKIYMKNLLHLYNINFSGLHTLIPELSKLFSELYLKNFHFLLSKDLIKKLNQILPHNQDFLHFVTLTELFMFNYFLSMNIVKTIFERKFIKRIIMTSFYGASAPTRHKQLMSSFLDIAFLNGLNPTNTEYAIIHYFGKFINKFSRKWRIDKPKLMLFYNLVRESCTYRRFTSFTVSSPYATFTLRPVLTYSKNITIKNKQFRFSYRLNNCINYNKLGTSFTANFIHFCDATVVTLFYKDALKTKVPGFTNHDRYFYHPAYGLQLYSRLKKNYLTLYSLNLLYKNFHNSSLIAAYTKETDIDYLKKSDLIHPNFVK